MMSPQIGKLSKQTNCLMAYAITSGIVIALAMTIVGAESPNGYNTLSVCFSSLLTFDLSKVFEYFFLFKFQ